MTISMLWIVLPPPAVYHDLKPKIIDIRQLCWREELKFEKTHLLDHYQAGAAPAAAWRILQLHCDQLQTANNTSPAQLVISKQLAVRLMS